MLNKLYLGLGLIIAIFVGLYAYGSIQFTAGYDKAQNEYNQRVLDLMAKNQIEKNKIQSKVKELQNALSNDQAWGSVSVPSGVASLLNKE